MTMLRQNGLLTLLVLLVASTAIQRAASSADHGKPNIVFVLFDDLGWGQPSCYNPQSKLRMPNLDKLASQGMRFTDAHSASAVCTPTRYGVLTGRYPWRIGQFGVLTTYSPPIIPPSRLTVASLLKQHGYATACIGKWHLGLVWSDGKPGTQSTVPIGAKLSEGPNSLGFDYFCGFTHARNIGSLIEQDRVVAHVKPQENQPKLLEEAIHWLERRTADAPFFLYFPMCPPHAPIVPAPELIGASGAADVARGDPRYGDWVFQGDAMLGAIMDVLARKGLAQNTLLLAASDNGAEGRAYAPLRDSKRSIYEGGHRVPLVARWPGKVRPGSTCDVTVCLNDLLATAAELTNARLPAAAGEDSASLLPALLDQGQASRPPVVHQSMQGDLAIRQGAWKLIFHKDGRRELFNLADDLSETENVLAAHPKLAQQLADMMQSYIERGRSTPGEAQRNEATISLNGTGNRERSP